MSVTDESDMPRENRKLRVATGYGLTQVFLLTGLTVTEIKDAEAGRAVPRRQLFRLEARLIFAN